ncbi:MAG: hypothetical protein IPH98_19540 [Saprospiraceae bacterium]|nr:hypothetical protein [Candidatus Defluviibacterium haderslevense]
MIVFSDSVVIRSCPVDKLIYRKWTATDSCGNESSCIQLISVEPIPGPFLICPNDTTLSACQAEVNAAFDAWLMTASFSGGCNASMSNNSMGAPSECGGSVTVTFTVDSDCGDPVTCSASFTVTDSPVILTCANDTTVAACLTQSAVDAAFNDWLARTSFTGGCSATLTNNNSGAPPICGGTKTVTFTVTSSCSPVKTCTATFTVTASPAVVFTCATNKTEAACQTQAAIDASFAAWLLTTTATGGCNGSLTTSPTTPMAPNACGGSTTVTWTYTSSCAPLTTTCSATFTVTASPTVVFTCATNKTEAACQTQAAIDASFAAWLLTTTASGGCNGALTTSPTNPMAPDKCGGSTTVTWTYTSSCAPTTTTCSATFTVTASPAVVFTCATNKTEAACQTQATIDASFATWLTTTTATGGCNGSLTTSPTTPMAPDKCGGSTTVTWTYTSSCAPTTTTCSATFTVTASPAVVFTCATDKTEAACQTQAAIDASFATWLTTTTASGGCNGLLTKSPTTPVAPDKCGGSTTVTWTYTSSCAPTTTTCSATFTVTASPAVVFTCATSKTEAACQTQAAIDASFAAWLLTTTATGGCNGSLTTSPTTPMAPNACGGSTTVTWTYTSSCAPTTTTCTATFTVDPSPPVVFTCATNKTEAACQTQAAIDASFAAWLLTTASGGCNGMLTTSPTTPMAPDECGGSTTVTWTYTSSCAPTSTTCSATFTVTASPAVVFTCATNKTEAACQTQAAIDASFAAWLLTTTASGGCNGSLTKSPTTPVAPDKCGGSTTVTWTYTSSCAPTTTTCSATFTVTASPAVVFTCAVNKTEAACQTQAAIDASFSTWLTTTTASGGCNGLLTKSPTNPVAPDKCGGSTTVTWTYTSSCAPTSTTCSATFTVDPAPPVVLTCATSKTEAACQTQAAIDASFAAWLLTTTATGGCNGMLTTSPTTPMAPDKCGGSTTVTWTYTSSCTPMTTTCTATFTVDPSPPVVLTCATSKTEAACQTQAAIDASFAAWLLTTTATGGCNGILTTSPSNPMAPDACGGSTTVTWTYTSSCAPTTTSCSATFTVDPSPPVVFTCATSKTEAACQTQAAIDASFAAWLLTTTASGGCNGMLTTSPTTPMAPDKCGGVTTVTWTYTSSCAPTTTSCTATFTVNPSPPVVFNCATSKTEAACQTQAAIDASFAAWLLTTTATGGCNGLLTTSPATPMAPDKCGGVTTVTWTYTSSCAPTTTTCTATFTVDPSPPVVLTCATNKTEAACQTQAAIDASFAAWLLTTTATGGCNGLLTKSPTNPVAPDKCGGSTTVTWTYTSSCAPTSTTCTATFTVDPAPPVVLTCATSKTEAACQTQAAIDASFAAWLLTTTATGGCNGMLTTSPTTPMAPDKCGGSTTVTWTYTSSCTPMTTTCTATFTVDPSPPVVFTCATSKTEAACQTQAAIDASFAAWLLTTTATGGCNGLLTTSPTTPMAPDKCGGSTTVTWTYTSSCAPTTTSCSATFTVDPSPPVVFTCATNKTEAACQTQAAIDASFAAWLLTTTASGGCNGMLTTSPSNPMAPDKCGGVTTVTWTYTSSCAPTTTSCTATFTVDPSPPVVFNCATSKTEAACQTQAAIDASFAAWLLTTTATGGCNGMLTTSPATPMPPDECGGLTTVTWTYTSSCAPTTTTCTATFTVDPAPPVVLTCATNKTEAACQTQAAIDASFAAWLLTTTATGGCNGLLTKSPTNPVAPDKCGGSTTVTWTYTSSCTPMTTTCTATFTVDPAPPVVLTCAVDKTEAACQTQAAIDASFATWLTTATATGGCNGMLTTSPTTPMAPDACGGSTTVTWTYTSSCTPMTTTCTATFTVDPSPPVVFTCAVDKTEAACQTQAAIDASFAAWLLTTTATGGCNGMLTTSPTTPMAPDACGGSTTVTWTYTSSCAPTTTTCTATFTVDPSPPVVLTCAVDKTEAACQTQAAIDASFAAWLLTTTASGGCNGMLTTSPTTPMAPDKCGGVTTVTWTYTSSCAPTTTSCTATFTVDPSPPVVFNCATSKTEAACQTQAAIDASFAAWLLTTTASGGCNGMLTTSPTTPTPPDKCGGVTTVTWTYTSSCAPTTTTCTATFTVDPSPPVVLTCATNKTEAACQTQAAIDASFAAWLLTTTATGGCNGLLTKSPTNPVAPDKCGGSTSVTWTYTSSCAPTSTTCTATFTVDPAPPVVLTCATSKTEAACQTQAAIDASFAAWLLTTTATGGCNGLLTKSPTNPVAPDKCGGSTTVTWTYTSSCTPMTTTCTATFTVDPSPPVVLTCATSKTEAACQTQAAIDASFAAWLLTTTATGGCNGMLTTSPSNPVAPDKCGGSTTVTWTYTSSCAPMTTTCTATFTVDPSPPVVFTCATSKTEAACQTQAAIDASFAAWLLTTTATGGCNGMMTTSPSNPMAPDACGGSTTVTWTYTSSCAPTTTSCTATFTVNPSPPVVFNCATSKTEAACQTQAAIDASFAAWLLTTTASGGCNGLLTTSPTTPTPPDKCGGVTTVTWTYTSSCAPTTTSCTATFTVDPSPPVVFTCASNKTEAACQTQAAIDASFAAWLLTTTASGGCNGLLTKSPTNPVAPDKCGGSTMVTWTYTSSCAPTTTTCTATFTVDPAPPVVLTCAPNKTEAACQTQAAIDASFAAWLLTTTATGGCNGLLTKSPVTPVAPDKCGGSTTVTWTYTSSCAPTSTTCSATFTVTAAPTVVLTCAVNKTEAACQTQAAIDASFAAWLLTTTATGGCNGLLTKSPTNPIAPDKCGGSTTVTWTYTSSCAPTTTTCSATFTVTASPPVVLTCATNKTEAACQTQAAINASFATWLTTTTATGGCNGLLTTSPATPIAPDKCGGSTTVTWTYTSSCAPTTTTCSATFTVNPSPPVVFTCATSKTEAACQTQAAINSSFAAWLLTTTASGGCNGSLTTSPATPVAPNACGGSTTVTWTYTSSCAPFTTSCSATFAVTASPPVVFNCAVNKTEAACQTQAAIDASFAAWLLTTTASGGCNGLLTTSPTTPTAPNACGGSTTVTWTYTSSCAPTTTTCSATFTVTASPAVVFTCATNKTEAACQTQAAIDASFAAWLLTTTASGGCNGLLTKSPATPVAPDKCGGSTTVTWTYTSSCAPTTTTCSATFTVTAAPAVVLTCATNKTEAACQTQAAIDASFAAWLLTTTATGGCNGLLTKSPTTPVAPDKCGGSTTVTWTYTSSCAPTTTTCSATFTVTASPAVVLTCATNKTEAACQTQAAIDASFAAWLATTTATGGCNGLLTKSPTTPVAPDKCGGSTTVTWTYTSSCAPTTTTCSATFTVTASPPVNFTCAVNKTEVACQTQAAINASFTAWLATTTANGGCNGLLTTIPANPTAPDKCGGSITVTWNYTSSCAPTSTTCSAIFTVSPSPPVNFTCAVNKTEAACQTQAVIDASFAAWLLTTTANGGCNGLLTTSPATPMAPSRCGGSTTVTWTYTSSCAPTTTTCSATFTVTASSLVVLNCASNKTEVACQSQAAIDASFAAWLLTTTTSGGCNPQLSNNNTGAPSACGGSKTVIFTVTSSCEVDKTCSAVFTVNSSPVVLNCPANATENACQSQSAINTKFNTWLTTVTTSGGCNASLSNNNTGAPNACGGVVTVTFTVTSTCEPNKTCTATFTVNSSPVVLTCPVNTTEAACQTQAVIDNKFSIWLATVTTSGGCNPSLSNNNTGAPNSCTGGSTTVTFTVTSTCEPDKTCSASFTVSSNPPLIINCPNNTTEAACQTQASIDAKFNTWLASATIIGGCNASISNDNTGPPNACTGGTKTVTFTVSSSCQASVTCSASFTVTAAPAVVFTCANNVTESACQTQAQIDNKFNIWLASGSLSGGCNATILNNNNGAPIFCGGTKTVIFTVTSSCEPNITCSATFTVSNTTAVALTCPSNKTEGSCLSQASIDSSYNAWLLTATTTGGCNPLLTNNSTGAPNSCGGTKTVVFTVTSSCEPNVTCSATFSVTAPPAVVLTCPVNTTVTSCQSQASIDSLFAVWLATASATGGCNASLSNNNSGAPPECGGSRVVTFTVTSKCETNKNCTAMFTVSNFPPPVITCPNPITVNCNVSTLPPVTGTATASDACGGIAVITYSDQVNLGDCPGNYSITRTWTATDKCNNFDVCNQLITVIDTTKPNFTLPPNITLYTGVIPSGVKTIVNYDFNTGTSYNNLRPKLYTGITSKVDTSSNMYMTTTGVISGNLAFTPNTLAGKALKVNDSQLPGIWRFNVGGNNLPLFNNFSVYVQARKNGVGSANTLLMDYSTDGSNWTNFSSTALTTGTWIQCTAPINGLAFPSQLFIRVRYTGGTNPQTKELYIDNFQIKGTRLADSCAYEDLPSLTGYPTNVNHPCDANPIVEYTDSISGGTCVNDTKVTRTWYVTDFCGNSSSGTGKQIITVKDTTGPVITCPGNGSTFQRKADTMLCYYTVIGNEFDPFAKDACSDSVTLSNNVNFTSSLNSEQLRVGLHNIVWTATDVCGNVSRCTVVVNVFEREPPVARCKRLL